MFYIYFETESRLLHEGTKYNIEVPTRKLQDEIANDLEKYGEVFNVKKLDEPVTEYPVLTKETYKRNI
ncbi:hypothetical protein [Pradoshia sp.]